MAITQTGSTLRHGNNDGANTGTISSITVPSDAEKVLIGISAWSNIANGLTTMTFTKGGVDTTMSKIAGDVGTSWQGALFWLDDPDTGSGKQATWDWSGAGSLPDASYLFGITFWTGCDAGLRDSDSQQSGSLPHNTPTLTAQSGDKIVCWAFAFCGSSEGTVDTWTNLSTLTQMLFQGDADAAYGTGDPSGNVSVGYSAATNMDEGGVCAAVLTPTAAADTGLAWITA